VQTWLRSRCPDFSGTCAPLLVAGYFGVVVIRV
jgi:hypothetical protein